MGGAQGCKLYTMVGLVSTVITNFCLGKAYCQELCLRLPSPLLVYCRKVSIVFKSLILCKLKKLLITDIQAKSMFAVTV